MANSEPVNVYSDYENCILRLHPNCSMQSRNITTPFNTVIPVPQKCDIGHGHEMIGSARVASFSSGNMTHRCQHRAINERNFGPKALNGIKSHFVDTLISRGFKKVTIIGDSVTIQLGNFLSCDFIRGGFSVTPETRFTMAENSRFGGGDLIKSHNGNGSVTIASVRMDAPCIYDACKDVDVAVRNFADNFGKIVSSQGQILIFNCGLHLHRKNMGSMYTAIQEALARHMLRVSKTIKHNASLLAFRETTAQHFQGATDGLYENILQSNNSSDHCCAKPQVVHEIDERDSDIIQNLEHLDPEWRKSLSWVKFHKISEKFFDMHVESSHGLDCSHYVYDVGMTDEFLQSILNIIPPLGQQ